MMVRLTSPVTGSWVVVGVPGENVVSGSTVDVGWGGIVDSGIAVESCMIVVSGIKVVSRMVESGIAVDSGMIVVSGIKVVSRMVESGIAVDSGMIVVSGIKVVSRMVESGIAVDSGMIVVSGIKVVSGAMVVVGGTGASSPEPY